MILHADASGVDPRRSLDPDDLSQAARAAPQVGRPPRAVDGLGLAAGVLGALALGAVTLLALSHERRAVEAPAPVTVAPAAKPLQISTLAPTASVAATPAIAIPAPNPNAVDPNQSRAAPLIVDNSASEGAAALAKPSAAAAPPTAQASTLLTSDEQFAFRVGGDTGPAHAANLGDRAFTVVQGSIIPAVLETALNSDLPGYARAIVSRDVRGFDGSRVVIPRGSRLIGQYKSGLSAGQSRVFVVWTRLIRPDGASIALGSPAVDEAGETGLAGKVSRHFMQRFGGAILLSMVGGAAGALGDGSSNTIVVGTSSQAQSAAAQTLQTDGKIPPTIRAPQGAPIQVFTARDLDFSGV